MYPETADFVQSVNQKLDAEDLKMDSGNFETKLGSNSSSQNFLKASGIEKSTGIAASTSSKLKKHSISGEKYRSSSLPRVRMRRPLYASQANVRKIPRLPVRSEKLNKTLNPTWKGEKKTIFQKHKRRSIVGRRLARLDFSMM